MGHDQIDQRSLAFGRLIAAHIKEDPSLIQKARATIQRWMSSSAPNSCSVLEEWKDAINASTDSVLQLLTGNDERSTRLRQSNPFAGLLTQQERSAVIRQFQNHDTPAT